MLEIDRKLRYRERCLRLKTGALLFGSAGDRLFAETLEKKPGFVGRIDFIHKLNITRLFEVKCAASDGYEPDFALAEAVWYPSHMTLTYQDEMLAFQETKFITQDDTAVSWMCWENRSNQPLILMLDTQAEQCRCFVWKGHPAMETPVTYHGFRVGTAVCSSAELENGPVILMPGKQQSFVISASAVNLETETLDDAVSHACRWTAEGQAAFQRHLEQYQAFFDGAPIFESSDEMLNQTWAYRWFILRHCMAKPGYGNLLRTVEYEGRSHKVSKKPFERSGWEFSKLIPLSTPLHLTELRWHQDHETVHDIARSFFDTADENGIARWAYVNEYGTPYANYMIWAVYRMYLTDGNLEVIRELLPAMKRFVDGHLKLYGSDRDQLQIERIHQRTGKEYQPSYWYFHRDGDGGYPKNPKDKSTYTPLKRVDRSVYHLLNLKGLARLCALCGEKAASAHYAELAWQLEQDILAKMWDDETAFFYDLHYQTDEKAMVKNIVGVYPYWAEITGEQELGGLERLFDPEHFSTGSAFASVSRECPAYRAEGGWLGQFIKGRDGCVWCGPSWPYTTGIALDAIARQSKGNQHCFDREFGVYLRQYCQQHFRDGDIHRPYLVEHYNAETGEPLSDDVDYNHSYFLELVIAHLCGVEITESGAVIDPIDIGLRYFRLDNVAVCGHRLAVHYSRGQDRPEKGLKAGFRVFLDGVQAFEADALVKTEVAF